MKELKHVSKNLTSESEVINPERYNIPGHDIIRFYEPNDGVSETDPNTDLSIAEMIAKYVAGEPISTREGEYDEDGEEFAIPHNFDLSDITRNQMEVEEGRRAIQEELDRQAADKIAKAQKKALRKQQAEDKRQAQKSGEDEGQRQPAEDNERSEEDEKG